jgi:hypothetical protein
MQALLQSIAIAWLNSTRVNTKRMSLRRAGMVGDDLVFSNDILRRDAKGTVEVYIL